MEVEQAVYTGVRFSCICELFLLNNVLCTFWHVFSMGQSEPIHTEVI